MSYIIFDGIKIGNLASGESGFDVDIFPVEMDSSPARQFTSYDPIGRNGSILIDDQKYPNVQTSYRILIRENSGTLFRDLCGFLLSRTGYCRLSDSWHSDEYYHAFVSEPITPIFDDNRGALKFYLTFTRKPQRFLVSGEESVITTTSQIDTAAFTNPTDFAAYPLIKWTVGRQYLISEEAVKLFDICEDNNGSAGQIMYKVGFYVPNEPGFLAIESYIPNQANITIDFGSYSAFREAGGIFDYDAMNLNKVFLITKGNSQFIRSNAADFFELPRRTKLHIVVPADINKLQFFPRWWCL